MMRDKNSSEAEDDIYKSECRRDHTRRSNKRASTETYTSLVANTSRLGESQPEHVIH
jgi:hypothetical protein